jgi:hypothetical protein
MVPVYYPYPTWYPPYVVQYPYPAYYGPRAVVPGPVPGTVLYW